MTDTNDPTIPPYDSAAEHAPTPDDQTTTDTYAEQIAEQEAKLAQLREERAAQSAAEEAAREPDLRDHEARIRELERRLDGGATV